MTGNAHDGHGQGKIPWRTIGWSAAVLLLLLPLAANAPWTLSDYVFAAVMFGSVGLAFELIARRSRNFAYRAGSVLGVIGAFLTVWVNGAVGMIGSEDNLYNLLFLCVPLVALLGSVVARFRARGVALAMLVAAVGHGLISAIGLSADLRGGIFSLFFVGPWLLAAALFYSSAPATPQPVALPPRRDRR